MINSIHLEQ